ncbi:hypothetical protein OSJ97_24750, partial [Escherichia coli]|nr:hypothetical protein [Escherichia coli]
SEMYVASSDINCSPAFIFAPPSAICYIIEAISYTSLLLSNIPSNKLSPNISSAQVCPIMMQSF